MSEKKNSIRSDIAKAMASTYRPTSIPMGGQRDTLEYRATPGAKFRPMPWGKKPAMTPLASPLGSGKVGKALADKYKPRKI